MVDRSLGRIALRLATGARAGLHLRAARAGRHLRVQRERHVRLAAVRVHPPLVRRGARNTGLQQAFLTSLVCALGATIIAMLLGALASLAVARYSFFGRETDLVRHPLPIALPGIVTGMALSTTFASLDIPLGFLTIIVGHATFCVVLVYNNAIARLRRTVGSFEEASADLGADTFQTFRYVTFPALRSALLAGGLLAFALSFDEVIVTIFMAGGVRPCRSGSSRASGSRTRSRS